MEATSVHNLPEEVIKNKAKATIITFSDRKTAAIAVIESMIQIISTQIQSQLPMVLTGDYKEEIIDDILLALSTGEYTQPHIASFKSRSVRNVQDFERSGKNIEELENIKKHILFFTENDELCAWSNDLRNKFQMFTFN